MRISYDFSNIYSCLYSIILLNLFFILHCVNTGLYVLYNHQSSFELRKEIKLHDTKMMFYYESLNHASD